MSYGQDALKAKTLAPRPPLPEGHSLCHADTLRADPIFRDELAALLRKIRAQGGGRIAQVVNVTGDRNTTTQIAGSGNRVKIG